VCSCVQASAHGQCLNSHPIRGPSIIHYGPGHQKSKTVAVTVSVSVPAAFPVTDNYMQPQGTESKSWLQNWTSAHVAHFSASSSWEGFASIGFGIGPGTFVYLLHILGFYDVSDIDQVLVAGISVFANNTKRGLRKIEGKSRGKAHRKMDLARAPCFYRQICIYIRFSV